MFLRLGVPLDPPAIPLGIGAALRRLARAARRLMSDFYRRQR
jgi:hypothetical protein